MRTVENAGNEEEVSESFSFALSFTSKTPHSFKVAQTIYMRVGYVFESRFSAGMV